MLKTIDLLSQILVQWNSMALKHVKILFVVITLALVVQVQAHPVPVLPAGDLDRLTQAGPVIRELVDRYGHLFAPFEQQILRSGAQELIGAGWYRQTNNPALEDLSISVCQLAVARIERVLDGAQLERIDASSDSLVRRLHRDWPSGRGLLLLRINQPGAETDTTPAFFSTNIDLGVQAPLRRQVQAPLARIAYGIVYLSNAVPGAPPSKIEIVARQQLLATLELDLQVPPLGQLEVSLVDEETGQPTPAMAGLYAEDHQCIVPPTAIRLDFWQNGSPAISSRPYYTARYWPGSSWEREVFIASGRIQASLPEGEYEVIAGKGPEYRPGRRSCRVEAGKTTSMTLSLQRWINMPARGWISGDGHVHFSRVDAQANRPLITWTKAEDVHVANILRMGDANRTYFEQYGFGSSGYFEEDGYCLVSGQEDPRTEELGHVLALNLSRAVRWPELYHLYDTFLNDIHVQGGLAGYAHVYQPPRPAFWVRRDMTLNIPKGKIDFLEVSGMGDVDDQLYYEFLNLGFQLTALAGSDVPWGDSVGVSRTYAYTGGNTGAKEWFKAVRQGNTFVTAGPMLQLKVNGQIPGSEIKAKAGDRLHIEASAEGWIAIPQYLEIVAQGDVIGRVVPTLPGQQEYRLQLDWTVKHSAWITARCSGALTSPVYVRVEDEPWWKREIVPQLVEIRLSQLREIEAFTQKVENGFSSGYADPGRLRRQMPALRERVEAARQLYGQLLKRFHQSLEK